MSWRFPRARERDGYPMDLEAVNRGMEVFIEEIEGNLNEHNWCVGAVVVQANVVPGATTKLWHKYQECDPGFAPGTVPPIANVANSFQVSSNMEWVVIGIMEVTIPTDCSRLYVIGTLQIEPSDNMTATTVMLGIQLGIRVDGVLLWETVIGGADRSNDARGEGFAAPQDSGVVAFEAVVPVTASRHRVEAVARTIRNGDFAIPDEFDYYMILNRELIYIELY